MCENAYSLTLWQFSCQPQVKKTQLTGALYQLAGAALAFSMRFPLASLQQPVSQSDLGGVLL